MSILVPFLCVRVCECVCVCICVKGQIRNPGVLERNRSPECVQRRAKLSVGK